MNYQHNNRTVQRNTGSRKWWDVVPVGATITENDGDHVTFEADNDGQTETGRWVVDVWTDDVVEL